METLELKFSVSCDGATRLARPVSYNGYSSVYVNGRKIPYTRISTDPRMIIDVPNSKPETVVANCLCCGDPIRVPSPASLGP